MRKHTYECDRCHETVSVEASEPPPGWWLFKAWPVPAPLDLGAALQEVVKPPQHLCVTCSIELLEWLGAPHLEATT